MGKFSIVPLLHSVGDMFHDSLMYVKSQSLIFLLFKLI